MSGFKALNIESDDESDIEVDDTKEIQIEEALKLYQSALKYHAEGPGSYDLAAQAYKELFDSEIFSYPESQTELQRIDIYGLSEPDQSWDDFQPGTAFSSLGLEHGPSTLPQILHLSHKNYAQFKLDALSTRFKQFNVTVNQILSEAQAALDHFVRALDKDDSDLDLWRRTSSVGQILDSKRVARFCLESVLDEDDTGLNGVLSLPGLEEGFASEQLRELISQLQDQLSILQSPLSASKRKLLSQMLKRKLHPYSDIIQRQTALKERGAMPARRHQLERVVLKAPSTWAELGDALLRQLMFEQHGTSPMYAGLPIAFDMTGKPSVPAATNAPHTSLQINSNVITSIERTFPTTMQEQFPGLDNGQPTTQPRIAPADPSMNIDSASPTDVDLDLADSQTMILPSRKRSGDAAGLGGEDGTEEGRIRSKRIRARDSNVEGTDNRQAILDANHRWECEQQLNEIHAADDWMFETVANVFEKLGIAGFGAAREVRHDMAAWHEGTHSTDRVQSLQDLTIVRKDIQAFLDGFSDQLAHLVLHGGENFDTGQKQNLSAIGGLHSSSDSPRITSGIAVLPNDGVHDFLKSVNTSWHQCQEVAWTFLKALLLPGMLAVDANSYAEYLWPEELKTVVVRVLVNYDDSIFARVVEELQLWKTELDNRIDNRVHRRLAELVQSAFELHLDIYSLIKQPNSGVEKEIVVAQGDRLQRWSDLAREYMHRRTILDGNPRLGDPLVIRFLWTTAFYVSVAADSTQEHMLECMKDLRATLISVGEPMIHLQNNAIMPELSVPALDREISKVTTKDFFSKVTHQDVRDPATVIETLEPLLETLDGLKNKTGEDDPDLGMGVLPADTSPELIRFLRTSDLSVRLLLWQKLRDAYSAISYRPMVVYCYLRMIRLVLDELKSSELVDAPRAERQITVLKSLRVLQTMTSKLYDTFQNANDCLDCVDDVGLRSAVSSFGEVLQLIQVFNVAEDFIRIGQSQPPTLPNGLVVQSFSAITKSIHEMQVQVWTIVYALLKEGISQNPDYYRTPAEDLFDFLRVVHRNLGLRGICGALNRSFVRLLKEEFQHMNRVDGYDTEQAQVLYDLYRLDCFLDPSNDLMEHRCTPDAFLDRNVALHTVDLLLAQASKLPMKELVKHSLRETIDKVHGSLPKKKITDAIQRNREIYRTYLRSPLNPVDLYQALKGDGNQLPVSPVRKDDALLASKGWYFLMGQMSLTRFRSQKRNAPTPTEEVDIAIAFFMQDLEYTEDNWETWFRLAQAYDTKIEESVVWSAEKLNNNFQDLVVLQRQAIHCYVMATALATRSAEPSFETAEKMSEMYYDFGNRLYGSARQPFSMHAFNVQDVERFVSVAAGVQKKRSFPPLHVYTAIKLANELYRRALSGMSDSWMVHHMIAKCLWKMHAAPDYMRPNGKAPAADKVVKALLKAIELLPDKDKKGETKKEPVLEPHFKLVSITHKLLTLTHTIDLATAKEILSHTHYASREPFPEDMNGWLPYILAVVRNLRSADKSNWHHRMVNFTAMLAWKGAEQSGGSDSGRTALAAKNELTPQMFTKTMVLQVWRPESERAGRHFVYTAQYTRFFAMVLERLEDRAGLEQLARRVRRRTNDIFEHSAVWQDICTAYLRLLRSHATLAEGLETSSFSNVPYEDFLLRKEPLEKWMQATEPGVSPALDVLRDVQELKKLNMGLMKPGAIDDLIGDAYAQLFNTMSKLLWEEERKAKQVEDARRAEEPPVVVSPARNPMMSLTHLMNIDGTVDAKPIAHAQTTLVPAPEAAPPRRKIGVGRREIRSCAESCYQKTKAHPAVANDAERKASNASRVQVLIARERPLAPGEHVAQTSAPGSVHDSADDESELSELEEADEEIEHEGNGAPTASDGARRPLFPGLATVNSGRKDDDISSETAEEGAGETQDYVEMEEDEDDVEDKNNGGGDNC